MAGCHDTASDARPFLVGAYEADGDEVLRPLLPAWCLHALPGDAPCRLRSHHFRDRKTGPCLPVLVASCSTHRHAFTIYPPGHVPYGREAVAPVGLRGDLLIRPAAAAEGSGGGPVSTPARLAWETTWFGAAQDAAAGVPWHRDRLDRPGEPGWSTQQRWLDHGARQLGLGADLVEATRERVALALDVPCLVLIEASRALAGARGYRARGAVVAEVLTGLPVRRSLPDDLLGCGYRTGLWGRPGRWDPGGAGGGVLRSPF